MDQDNFYQQAQKIARSPFLVKSNFVVNKNNSVSYIKYRVLRPLLKFYYQLFNQFYPNSPWTTPGSILIFRKLLNKEMTALEYGSGRSTVFFARRTKQLISVEHDKKWYSLVKLKLKELKISNVDYRFIGKFDPVVNTGASANPSGYIGRGMPESFKPRYEFHKYYEFVCEFPDAYFDFILIDGRARVECLVNSIDKIKPNGMMVLDNSNRKRYHFAHTLLESWPKVVTTNGISDTTIWFKPGD